MYLKKKKNYLANHFKENDHPNFILIPDNNKFTLNNDHYLGLIKT